MHAPASSFPSARAISLLAACVLIATSACASAPVGIWPEDGWLFARTGQDRSDSLAYGREAPLSFVVTCEGPCRPWFAGDRVVHFLRSEPSGRSTRSLTAPGVLTISNGAGLAVWHGTPKGMSAENELTAYDSSGSLVWDVPCYAGFEAISSRGDVVHVPSYSPLGELTHRDAMGFVVDMLGEVVGRFQTRSRMLPAWSPDGTHFYCVSTSGGSADTLCCYTRSGDRVWTSAVGIDAAPLSPGSAVLSAGDGLVACVSRSWPWSATGRAAPTRRLRAYDGLSGALLWEDESQPNAGGSVACAVSSDGSTVYSFSRHGRGGPAVGLVFCSRDGRTGRILSEVRFPRALPEGASVKPGSLAASPDGRLASASVRVMTSEEKWQLAVFTRTGAVVAATDVLEAPITWWVDEASLAVQSNVETTVHTFSGF